jgi:hypothetical protein
MAKAFLMVGRPCGQFQGCSISPMWSTNRRMSPAHRHIIKACSQGDLQLFVYRYFSELTYYRMLEQPTFVFLPEVRNGTQFFTTSSANIMV